MSPKSPAVLQLLRQLDLPASANKAQIRAAYLRKVKVLHPDVAGKSAEERFRQLKEDYEHGMEALKKGAQAQHSHRGHSRHAYGAQDFSQRPHHHSTHGHRRHWDPNPWRHSKDGPNMAHRLRNMSFAAFGVFGLSIYMLTSSPNYAAAPPRFQEDSNSKQREADIKRAEMEAEQIAARTSAEGGPATPAAYTREKSDYYKNRLTRSSVRVRGSDAYVSPSEAAKSREKREGIQYSARALVTVNRGHLWGCSAMQGWRTSMEDSHLAVSFEDELDGISFFGVFDGHGGSEVAAFCKQYMPDEISRQLKERLARGARLSGDCLGEVLTASFHAMDDMLRSPDYERPLLALKQAARPGSKGQGSSSSEAAGSSSSCDAEEAAEAEEPTQKPRGVLSLLSNSIESDLAQARDKGSLSRDEAKQVMMKMALLRKLESKAPALGPDTGAADNVGCTAVCILLTRDEIVCANAGDSRAVLCRKGGPPVALSQDHKPNDAVERERIEAAGGRIEEISVGIRVHYRVNGNLNLSRSIGDLEYKKSPELGHERQMICSTPDIVKMPRMKDDDFIILACDGVWDVKSNEDVCSFMKEKLHGDDAEAIIPAVESLLDDCIAEDPKKTNGLGGDNMTCLVVQLQP